MRISSWTNIKLTYVYAHGQRDNGKKKLLVMISDENRCIIRSTDSMK